MQNTWQLMIYEKHLLIYMKQLAIQESQAHILAKLLSYISGEEELVENIISGKVLVPSPILIDQLKIALHTQSSTENFNPALDRLKDLCTIFYTEAIENEKTINNKINKNQPSYIGKIFHKILCSLVDLKYSYNPNLYQNLKTKLWLKIVYYYTKLPTSVTIIFVWLFFVMWYTCINLNVNKNITLVLFPSIFAYITFYSSKISNKELRFFRMRSLLAQNIALTEHIKFFTTTKIKLIKLEYKNHGKRKIVEKF
jgi:hypothetical protein